MLDRESRKVLRTMRKSNCDMGRGVFSHQHLSEITGFNEDDLIVVLDYLEENKLIANSNYTGGISAGVYLSQLGKHPIEFCLQQLCAFLVRSIVVPLVVAALTALITLWITGYFTA